jgi:tape measure domain-containing protein
MADASTELKIRLSTPGAEKLPGLARSFQKFGFDVKRAGLSVTKLGLELKKQQATGIKSINNTRALSNTWKELANSVEFGSRAFQVATARAARLDKELAKMQGRRMGAGGRFGTGAKIGGTIAAAGVFGGPAGALGAGIGGVFGGLPGAAAGGAYGAIVGGAVTGIGEMASYDAALEKQRKALRLVIGDTTKFSRAQAFLAKMSQELAIPQDVIVRQFTQLTASVTGAGLSVEDAEKAFKAIASGIRGTGGELEDMRAAMVATSQVFSKGKVSAEELRQQLGERLPGAFTLFAESMGKTPAELDKALEGGKVTLQDFMKFTETLTDEYFENAKKLAAGPEAAGDRLKKSMSDFKDAIGDILRPIGAAFQNTFANIVTNITEAIKAFNKFMGIGLDNAILKAERAVEAARAQYESAQGMTGPRGRAQQGRTLNRLSIAEERLRMLREEKAIQDEVNGSLEKTGKTGKQTYDALTTGAMQYAASVKSISEEMADVFEKAFKSMEDQLVNFVTTGTFEFKKFAQSVINDLIRIYIRQAMVASISSGGPLSFLGGIFGKGGVVGGSGGSGGGSGSGVYGSFMPSNPAYRGAMANGGVFARNGIQKFARGGIVSNPTLFRFANGTGLMGEAGPEAIMPLRRGPGGRLGVEAAGGGTNVVVNVDASGSSVEGEAQSARELGAAISAAIQQQLVKERRPGGLLYA